MNTNHTRCHNAFSDRIFLTATQSTVISILLALYISPIIIVNISLALALFKKNLLNSRSRWYVFLLTLSDGFITVTVILLLILFTKYGKTEYCAFENIVVFLLQFNMHVSAYLVLLIAFHRYLKIHPNLKSRTYKGITKSVMSGRLANFLVIVCFVLPIFHGLSSCYFFGYIRSKIPIITTKAVSGILFVTIYILYFRLYYRIARKHKQTTVNITENLARNARKYSTEFTKTVFLIMIALFVNLAPFIVMDLWTSWYTHVKHTESPLVVRFIYYLSCVFMTGISFMDGAIFIYRNKIVREYLNIARLFRTNADKAKPCERCIDLCATVQNKGLLPKSQGVIGLPRLFEETRL